MTFQPTPGFLLLLQGPLLLCLCGACADATHELETIEELSGRSVSGQRVDALVEVGSSVATDVRVTGRCGQHELEAVTDGNGEFSWTLGSELADCASLRIEHVKTGFLPRYIELPVPLPESTFRYELGLRALEPLECGSERCVTDSGTELPTGDRIARGYQASGSGARALDAIPVPMRSANGELISFLGFHYLQLFDADGAELPSIDAIEGCTPVNDDGLDLVGDVDRSTAAIELDWYRYDAERGEWSPSAERARLMYERGNVFERDDDGRCRDVRDERNLTYHELLPLERASLADARAREHYVPNPCGRGESPPALRIRRYWVCGPIDGGGFYAYGLSTPEQSCYALRVSDGCGEPQQGVKLSVRGLDHGYQAISFSRSDGFACVDVPRSEPIGEDFDHDQLGGEIRTVELEIDGGRLGRKRVDAQENSRTFGTCEEPDTCVQLTEQFRRCAP